MIDKIADWIYSPKVLPWWTATMTTCIGILIVGGSITSIPGILVVAGLAAGGFALGAIWSRVKQGGDILSREAKRAGAGLTAVVVVAAGAAIVTSSGSNKTTGNGMSLDYVGIDENGLNIELDLGEPYTNPPQIRVYLTPNSNFSLPSDRQLNDYLGSDLITFDQSDAAWQSMYFATGGRGASHQIASYDIPYAFEYVHVWEWIEAGACPFNDIVIDVQGEDITSTQFTASRCTSEVQRCGSNLFYEPIGAYLIFPMGDQGDGICGYGNPGASPG